MICHLVGGKVEVGRRRWRQVCVVVDGCVHFRLDDARRVFAVHRLMIAATLTVRTAIIGDVVFVLAQ